jgi:hypothetical protein
VAGTLIAVRGPGSAHRRSEALDLSGRFALALGSYDYHHLPQDVAAVEALSTAAFRHRYSSELATQAFQQTLVASQTVARASVVIGPFVAAVNGRQADTVVVISQTITGKETPTPLVRRSRVELDLVHTTAGWRVDQADITGS